MCKSQVSDAQEPFEFDFQHWLGLGQRENNEENYGNIEGITLISKLQTWCIIAQAYTGKDGTKCTSFDRHISGQIIHVNI